MRVTKRMDINRKGDQFIVAGLASLVEDSGMTAHEALEVLEDIKRQTWHALAEIQREAKSEVPK